jgi:hypothetical protein
MPEFAVTANLDGREFRHAFCRDCERPFFMGQTYHWVAADPPTQGVPGPPVLLCPPCQARRGAEFWRRALGESPAADHQD